MRLYILLICFTLLVSACKDKTVDSGKAIRSVKYEKITSATGLESHTFSGVVKAKNVANLSFKVGGIMSSVKVKLGDKVKKGQLIASIDPVDYAIQTEQAVAQKKGSQANVESSEANLKIAESQLINARSTFDRVEKLYENNSLPLSEYQKAQAGFASAEAQYDAAVSKLAAATTQVTAAEKQVQAAGNQVNYTRLVSPMDGIITTIDVEPNEIVNAGRVIAVVSSDGNPQVEVGVPEVLINKINKGQLAHIILPSAPGQKFSGSIEQIAFAAGSSPTYPVIVGIDKSLDQIRPGMAANVSFIFNESEESVASKLFAPIAAVGKDAQGNFIYVLTKDSNSKYHAEKRNITIGKLLPEGFEIVNGIAENELVATAGLKSLMDGMEVTLLED